MLCGSRRWLDDLLLAYVPNVPKPWWKDPAGLPPSLEKNRNRDLRPWEVTVYRLYLPLWPLAILGFAFTIGGPSSAVMAVLPLFQFLLLPGHQQDQVLGRRQ